MLAVLHVTPLSGLACSALRIPVAKISRAARVLARTTAHAHDLGQYARHPALSAMLAAGASDKLSRHNSTIPPAFQRAIISPLRQDRRPTPGASLVHHAMIQARLQHHMARSTGLDATKQSNGPSPTDPECDFCDKFENFLNKTSLWELLVGVLKFSLLAGTSLILAYVLYEVVHQWIHSRVDAWVDEQEKSLARRKEAKEDKFNANPRRLPQVQMWEETPYYFAWKDFEEYLERQRKE